MVRADHTRMVKKKLTVQAGERHRQCIGQICDVYIMTSIVCAKIDYRGRTRTRHVDGEITAQNARVEYRLDVRDVRADTGKEEISSVRTKVQDVGTTAAIDAGGAVERYPTEGEEVEGVVAAAAGGSHMAGTTEIHGPDRRSPRCR